MILDDNLQPRNSWKKGIIDEVIYGKDNQARGVKLITISKTGLRPPCYRPIQKIIPFEIVNKCEKAVSTESKSEDSSERNELEQDPTKRSTRKAAIEGEQLRRLREKYY